MRAMILAAGRGTRMGHLTKAQPKPLITVGGMPLIEHHVRALAASGFVEIVINVSYLAEQIIDWLGDGGRFGVAIAYSNEQPEALETAGGIANALRLLGDQPFAVINGDIWSDYPLYRLQAIRQSINQTTSTYLVLVPNPAHHPSGDFGLTKDKVKATGSEQFTFSGIGLYRPEFFSEVRGTWPLAPLLFAAMAQGQVRGELFKGHWWDVGTPQRLAEVNGFLTGR